MTDPRWHAALAEAVAGRQHWTIGPIRASSAPAHATYLPGDRLAWGQVWSDHGGWVWSVWNGIDPTRGRGADKPEVSAVAAVDAVESYVAEVRDEHAGHQP